MNRVIDPMDREDIHVFLNNALRLFFFLGFSTFSMTNGAIRSMNRLDDGIENVIGFPW